MCRSFKIVYKNENEISGMSTLDFHVEENIFSNSSINPVNKGIVLFFYMVKFFSRLLENKGFVIQILLTVHRTEFMIRAIVIRFR